MVGGAAVAGYWVDASHFNVCACQGGTAGEMGTVTARYPAKALAAGARVPGVELEQAATFVLGAAKGAGNPAACPAPSALPAAAPVTRAPTTTAPVTQVLAAPAPALTSSATVPTATARPAQSASAPLAPSAARQATVALAGVTVTGTPASATLAWPAIPGVASYVVTRAAANTAPVNRS